MTDMTPYSKREIDEKWQEIANALSRIEIQTTTTNGRVSKLERWQSYVLGFCAGISLLLCSVLIPLFGIAAGFLHFA
jgi:hypothetical protein